MFCRTCESRQQCIILKMVSQTEVQCKGLTLEQPATSSPRHHVRLIMVAINGSSRVCATKYGSSRPKKTPLYLLINTMNRTRSFKYTVRIIAIYIITFVDRSLFVFAYNHENNFHKAKIMSGGGGGLNQVNIVQISISVGATATV